MKERQESFKEEPEEKEEKQKMSRREFLHFAGGAAAGAILGGATERIAASIEEGEEEPEADGKPETLKEEEIPQLAELLDYDNPDIKLEPETVSRLKEHWKRRYSDPEDPLRLDKILEKSWERMKEWDP